ncbi:hypothetical protein HZH68_011556 [Vespula germanica]|uniref:Uncharacterized protein n=1 Tax=Vespula germanica TaxID=30212 RepID=A0A834N2P0_VESGE|nr:hypothetical protein HZH68_011556 [Vespula germanica]
MSTNDLRKAMPAIRVTAGTYTYVFIVRFCERERVKRGEEEVEEEEEVLTDRSRAYHLQAASISQKFIRANAPDGFVVYTKSIFIKSTPAIAYRYIDTPASITFTFTASALGN